MASQVSIHVQLDSETRRLNCSPRPTCGSCGWPFYMEHGEPSLCASSSLLSITGAKGLSLEWYSGRMWLCPTWKLEGVPQGLEGC